MCLSERERETGKTITLSGAGAFGAETETRIVHAAFVYSAGHTEMTSQTSPGSAEHSHPHSHPHPSSSRVRTRGGEGSESVGDAASAHEP